MKEVEPMKMFSVSKIKVPRSSLSPGQATQLYAKLEASDAYCKSLIAQISRLQKEREELANWKRAAIELLTLIEFGAVAVTDRHAIPACPACWNWKPHLGADFDWGDSRMRGHKATCVLAVLIGRPPENLQGGTP